MSADKKRILLEIILSLIVLLLSIVLIILIIIITIKRPKPLETYELNDILITTLESFDFIENKTIPQYPNNNLLGITGKLILDCYTGTCIKEIEHEEKVKICDEEDNAHDCEYVEKTWFESKPVIDLYCSEQCYQTGEDNCNCQEPFEEIGTCERNSDDEYKKGKICYASNAIYFWKGKKYQTKGNIYSYLNDAILKEEQCPEGNKICGVLDDNGNQLCIDKMSKCPINYISENESSNDYSSVLIGNKTFYYGYDSNLEKQIIEGLIVDSDLLLNNSINAKQTIDEHTISGLLEDNKNIYKDVNLGYDPYKTNNIDAKGKSYLRILYFNQNVDLSKLREDNNKLIFNRKINNDALNTIETKTKTITVLGLIALGYLLIIFIIFLCIQYSYYRKGNYGKCSKFWYLALIAFFFLLMIVTLVFCCINVSKAKKAQNLDPNNKDYSTFKNLNLAFIIIGLALCLFLVAYIVLVPVKSCFEEKVDEKTKNEINETGSATENNLK